MRVPVRVDEQQVARDRDPVQPRDAATIALIQPTTAGVSTYLLTRASSMAFAPDHAVFPGGRVDPADGEPICASGPGWDEWADRLQCSPAMAQAFVVAAARETFEESGILLAGSDGDSVVDDVSGSAFTAARAALEAHETSFAAVLVELGAHLGAGPAGLTLRTDLIHPWARWITPRIEPRRYDTRIFAAMMPAGQRVGSLPSEARRGNWTLLTDALEALERGELTMLPPTSVTCRALVEAAPAHESDLADAAGGRSQQPIEPRLVQADGRWYLDNDSDVQQEAP